MEIETLQDKQGFLHLMRQSSRLDLADAAMLRRQMTLFARLIQEGRVKRLCLGWGFDLLPTAAALIIQQAEATALARQYDVQTTVGRSGRVEQGAGLDGNRKIVAVA